MMVKMRVMFGRYRTFLALLLISACCGGCRRDLPETNTPDEGGAGASGNSSGSATSGIATAADAFVNPPWLFERAPADSTKVDWDAELRLSLRGNPNTLNPVLMSSAVEERLKELLFDYPFIFDAKFRWSINPAMTESFVESGDHRSATLVMKNGLTWHDGAPLTAHDVVFSWEQIMDEDVPARSARGGTDQIAKCTAVDNQTVRFDFAEPYATNKWGALFAIIPRHIYEVGKTDDPTLARSKYHVTHNRSPIGNGPYRFVSWESDDRIVLERWKDYPGRKPFFAKITLRIIPIAQARLLAFERGEIDEAELSPEQFANGSDTTSFRKAGVKGLGSHWRFNYIGLSGDGSNPFFADRNVRRAVSHAVNYDRIVSQVFHGLARRARGIFHPDSPMYHDGIDLFSFDLKLAGKLLDKAGWAIDSDDGWRYKTVEVGGEKVRTRLTFTVNLAQPSTTSPLVAAIVAEDLKKIGVEMKSRVLEWATFLEHLRNREFEAFMSAWNPPVDPDYGWNVWHSTAYESQRNYVGYADKRVDDLFAKGRKCFDHDERMGYYAELSKIIYDDAPYVFLVNSPILWAFDHRLRGVEFSPRGPFMFEPGIRNWWMPVSAR